MSFLKKLFQGTPQPSPLYTFHVKCSRCGETIEGQINLQNDLSAEYEDDREVYFVRKVLIGSDRCFQSIEAEFSFTPARELIERHVTGGEFV